MDCPEPDRRTTAAETPNRALIGLLLWTLGGAVLLCVFSSFQKMILGTDPFVLRGYLVPMFFGSLAGLGIGLATNRQRREFRARLADREQAAAALAESEERFRLLAENARDTIFRWSIPKARYDYISPAVFHMTGWTADDFAKDPGLFRRLVCEEDRPLFDRLDDEIRDGDLNPSVVFRLQHRDGHIVWISQRHVLTTDGAGTPLTLEGISSDITAIRQAQIESEELNEQLRQSQKVEAIGRLAGGIAHDFNNLLTVIQGYAELILEDLDPESELYQQMETIRAAGVRASEMTGQLLAFSRKQKSEPVVMDPLPALESSLVILRRLLGSDIEMELHGEENLPRVIMDPNRLEQVLMNLAINARDAMPEGGRLKLALRRREFVDCGCTHCGQVLNGTYLEVAMTDTGTGIPDDILDSIFDPFFTTKEKSKGTGLGLASVFGIIRQHEGHMLVDSKLGEGSTFRVILPATERDEVPADQPAEPALRALWGSETILVVEDEQLIRRLTQRFLEQYGYRVFTAENGEEAVEFHRRTEEKIDLLLTDVIMPGMNGHRLSHVLQTVDPQMKVLYMSGFSDNFIDFTEVESGEKHFLQKPFGAEALVRKVREIFDRQD